jgi:RimJ/RimL family protein N-acetyltransferase
MALAFPDLHDDVIALRQPEERDLDAITAACQDPDIPKYTRVPSPYTRESAEHFLKNNRAAWVLGEKAPEVSFLIVDRTSDRVLGTIGLKQYRDRDACEVGYWLAADARGNGYVTRAVRLVARWGLEDLGFRRCELTTAVDNTASQAVAARAGFTREGVLRSYTSIGSSERKDAVMFSLLPAELER